MRTEPFQFTTEDGVELYVYKWTPDDPAQAKGVVHIAHGLAEHAARYGRVAGRLTAAGYIVYANDHRGHGKTIHRPEDQGYFADSGGWDRCVADLAALVRHEHGEHPGLPLVLFGHSMGSMLTQQILFESGGELAGAVLSGSSGKAPPIAGLARIIARIERMRLGPRGRSRVLRALTFDDFNKKFAPNRTAFDWLSRDEEEVDTYVADPLCGFEVSTQLWLDMLLRLSYVTDPANQARIPKELPIYIFSGDRDPVGGMGKSVALLRDAYAQAGVRNITFKLYAGGRHEMLNETNRDEVTSDLLAWLDATIGVR